MVTSESQKYADIAKKNWRLPSLALLGDPSLSLARHLKEANLLNVFISVPDPKIEPWTAGHPFMSTYGNGVAQPATLFVSQSKEIMFAHTVVPSPKNAGGAVDRPLLDDVWRQVLSTHLGKSSTFLAIRRQTFLDSTFGKILVSLLILGTSGVSFLLALIVRSMLHRNRALVAA